MTNRRGALLVLVLLVTAVLFISGLTLATRQRTLYSATTLEVRSLQALALAEAGIEDARVKLNLDPDFPPQGSPEQTQFTFSESLTDSSGRHLGSYTVTVDSRYLRRPFQFYLVRSKGVAGEVGQARAVRVVTAEIQVEDRTVFLQMEESL